MKSDWIPTSSVLPPEGSMVEFVLDHRDMAMSGIYRQRLFASRWSEYEMTAVREWRPASAGAGLAQNAPAQCGEPARCAEQSR